jgi:hypothetical protein
MKQKLWAFGDSFTFGHGCRADGPLSEYYHSYRNEGDKIWVDIMAEKFDLEAKNFGECGVSNDYIIDCIIDNWYLFKENDYVIIGTTWSHRFDVPLKDRLLSISWNWHRTLKNIDYSQEQIDTIINFQYHFADNNLYRERQLKRLHFLEKLLKDKKINVILWNVDYFARSAEFERIATATNGKIQDYHFSFNGHRDLAKILISKILKNTLI